MVIYGKLALYKRSLTTSSSVSSRGSSWDCSHSLQKGMKGKRHFPLLAFVAFMAVFFLTFSMQVIDARKHHHHGKKGKSHKHQKSNSTANSPAPGPAPLPSYGSHPNGSRIFNVLSFGAKGDGDADDSKVNQMQLTKRTIFFFTIKPVTSLI